MDEMSNEARAVYCKEAERATAERRRLWELEESMGTKVSETGQWLMGARFFARNMVALRNRGRADEALEAALELQLEEYEKWREVHVSAMALRDSARRDLAAIDDEVRRAVEEASKRGRAGGGGNGEGGGVDSLVSLFGSF